jgi:hypothetical protein
LIDQASSDLEQVEAQVAAAAERLADLQAQNLAAIEALEVVKQRRVQAEQVEASAHVALRVGGLATCWVECNACHLMHRCL